ncbi:DDE superfamily endonuclease [Kibdelosporangium aridum]|uniref:DDE superfamily endonuclease n=1 Tax=Kibdelosporangium aridum TaxID=2030 RepID=A0A1W2FEX3_KIBAR|nr:DDE superfamily endonuclease [Kibdelosporangium aridum]
MARRDAAGVPEDVTFRAKPQLAQDILTGMIADDTMPPWVAGDEVCGRSGPLRKFLQDNGIGYVMGSGAPSGLSWSGRRMRADAVVATHLTSRKHQRRWADLLGDRVQR